MFDSLKINTLFNFSGKYHISYSISGSSNKFLVCVHGITRNCRDFDYFANFASKNYQVICPDILGRGKSSWLENKQDYNYLTYCKMIMFLLKHLKIDQIDFIGTSMGGIIGIYLAFQYPNLINKLVLNDIGPFIDIGPLKKIAEHISIFPTFQDREEALIYIKSILRPFGIKEENIWQHLLDHSINKNSDGTYNLAVDPKIAIAFNDEIGKIQYMDIWNLWQKINCKILIVRGQQSEILTRNTLKKMVQSKKDVNYIEYPNIGHAPSLMEDYQIKDITKWLLSTQ